MSDAIERLANGKARLAWTIKRAIGVSVPVNECGRAAEAVLSALHLSPDAAAGLADGSWVAVPRVKSVGEGATDRAVYHLLQQEGEK